MLFAPLVLFVYIAADPVLRGDLPEIGFLFWLMAIAYLIALIRACLTAGVDWALSGKPLYLRLIATMPVAAIMAELVARYLGQPYLDLTTVLMGAIPAAVCSWLSDKPKESLSAIRQFGLCSAHESLDPTKDNRASAVVGSALLLFVSGTSQRVVGWDVLIVAVIVMFVGMWVGQFKFKKNQGKTDA
jgi:hypothetical protein